MAQKQILQGANLENVAVLAVRFGVAARRVYGEQFIRSRADQSFSLVSDMVRVSAREDFIVPPMPEGEALRAAVAKMPPQSQQTIIRNIEAMAARLDPETNGCITSFREAAASLEITRAGARKLAELLGRREHPSLFKLLRTASHQLEA